MITGANFIESTRIGSSDSPSCETYLFMGKACMQKRASARRARARCIPQLCPKQYNMETQHTAESLLITLAGGAAT